MPFAQSAAHLVETVEFGAGAIRILFSSRPRISARQSVNGFGTVGRQFRSPFQLLNSPIRLSHLQQDPAQRIVGRKRGGRCPWPAVTAYVNENR